MITKKIMYLWITLAVGMFCMYACDQNETDADNDGIADKQDNCVYIANPDQKDMDNDGFGDVCDNCPATTFLRFPDQRDSDGDGIGDLCDNCINTKNEDQSDMNHDGIGDACTQAADLHHYRLLAKASPDECYYGMGESNIYDPEDFDAEACVSSGGKPKFNDGYIWGMTKIANHIYFGTYANAVCTNFDNAHPFDTTDIWVCERFKEDNVNPVVNSDFRPPSIHVYNTDTGHAKRLAVNEADIPILNITLGLRSAANHKGVVFLAGPSLKANKINVFAFNAETGEPLGAKVLPYNNIRKWLVVKDTLYCGVSSIQTGGAVLKWTGSMDDPFKFEIVGRHFAGGASYMCFHEGRIFVNTWPFPDMENMTRDLLLKDSKKGIEASIWMSPVIDDELDSSQADQWEKVWSVYDYDPDWLCAFMSAGGPLVSYKGWLYWSTMHIKNQAQFYLLAKGMVMCKADREYTPKGAYRATAIFRGRNFDQPLTKTIELLYGEESLDVYTAAEGWKKVSNKMDSANRKPKYGHSGFGNWANNYMWTMAVYKGKLYLGTMDDLGADLYCFPNSDSEARPVNLLGLGNMANFGIRNMVSDDEYLYMGTANHYNLSTYTAEELLWVNPELEYFMNTDNLSGLNAAGGWELIRLEAE